MAELHVQKHEATIWPWIIGLLVLAVVVWFASGRDDDVNPMPPAATDSTYTTPPPGMPTNPSPPTR